MPKPPAISKTLTEADWNSKKGVVAKIIKGETGIGAAMNAVKTEYDKVDWKKYDASAVTPSATFYSPAHADNAFQAGKTEYSKIEEVRKKLVVLRDLCKTTAESWKRNKLIPSSSREHVEKIQKEADTMWIALKDNGTFFTEFKTACDSVKKLLATSSEKIKAGEKPQDWNYEWFKARKPTVGFVDDPKMETTMMFFWKHYEAYIKDDRNSTDEKVLAHRVNCLRQMIAGLDQTEAKLKTLIGNCKPGVHDNTKAALQHYLNHLLPTYRKQRKAWIDMEKEKGKKVPYLANDLQVRIIAPGLDRL